MALSGRIPFSFLRNLRLSSNIACFSTKVGENSPLLSNNDLICQEFRSRNPRNLEFLRLAYKPEGYGLDIRDRRYWYKLVIKVSQHSVKAEVLHHSGTVITSVSSSEWGIKKQLYRYTDSCAFKAVGAVLASRLLECGLNRVFCTYRTEEGTKMHLLLDALKTGGVGLSELSRYRKPDPFRKIQQRPPWDNLHMV